jgi:mannose-6-phosphate isomerase-like protein (cupin superfamily)
MFYSLTDTKQYDIPGGRCYLYPDSPTGRLSCALVEQAGRYPSTGFRQNAVCTEALFIIDGNFQVTVNGRVNALKPRDIVYIPPHTPYAVDGKGTVFVFIEPKWNSDQNTAV